MAIAVYTAKVQDKRLLELPEEAIMLGLERGDEVEISVQIASPQGIQKVLTPQERAKAYRSWAESHSDTTPLLSDDAISRESFYGERG